jgi:hypothetical protein
VVGPKDCVHYQLTMTNGDEAMAFLRG